MHVLQLGPFPPPEGGISRNMLAIRDELRKRGDRCSIIATSKSTGEIAEPDVHFPRSASDFIRTLRSIDFDVLHYHVGGAISTKVFALLAASLAVAGKRSVLTLHSGGYALEKAPTAGKLNRDAFIFRAFGRVIGVNSLMMDLFSKYGVAAEKARLILPFSLRSPDPDVSIPPELDEFSKSRSPFVLTVGMLTPEHDIEMQIGAFRRVLASKPDAGLMILGSGPLEGELRSAIDATGYADRIMLAGDTAHDVTLHLITRADAVLRTTRFDGDAISIREALFLGAPVVTTDNGMRPDGVELIPVGDGDALAAKIIAVSANGRDGHAPKTDDVANIEEVLGLYDELLSSRGLTPETSNRARVF